MPRRLSLVPTGSCRRGGHRVGIAARYPGVTASGGDLMAGTASAVGPVRQQHSWPRQREELEQRVAGPAAYALAGVPAQCVPRVSDH